MMLVEEQGWSPIDKNVCADCLTEPALANAVRHAVAAKECDYCGHSSEMHSVAAPVDVLLEAIVEGVRTEYGDPDDEGIMYVSAEGGYTLPTFDTWDLLRELEITDIEDLYADLSVSISGSWCRRNPYRSSPAEALSWGWAAFRDHVTHTSRYMFHLPSPNADRQRADGEIPPEDMLGSLSDTIKSGNLTSMLPVGTRWVRVRPHGPEERPTTAQDLGSPPSKHAKANRMSAAGISAFYGSEASTGALAEVKGYVDSGTYATVGSWQTLRPMLVLDLVDLPPIPSLFDLDQRHLRSDLQFLHAFAADVTHPARPDDKQNLDYVPTQIVAEYLNQLFKDDEGNPVMGVLWTSTKDTASTNCVLFVGSDGCVSGNSINDLDTHAWLELDPTSIQVGRFTDACWVEEDET